MRVRAYAEPRLVVDCAPVSDVMGRDHVAWAAPDLLISCWTLAQHPRPAASRCLTKASHSMYLTS